MINDTPSHTVRELPYVTPPPESFRYTLTYSEGTLLSLHFAANFAIHPHIQ